MEQIMLCRAGSHLYGTNTPDSDEDFKAVHVPGYRDILMGSGQAVISTSTGSQTSSNTAADTDHESFSLARYLELASKMQTIPVEMLFIPEESLLVNTPMWQVIRANRMRILNRNAKAFVGYCRAQAVRYSLRGDKLRAFEQVVEALSQAFPKQTLMNSFNEQTLMNLRAMPQVTITPKPQPGGGAVLYMSVFGRECPLTVKAAEALSIYQLPVNTAGERAKRAKDAGGVDLKALYHAVRIAYEGIRLFRDGDMVFPCENLPFLMAIREGRLTHESILDRFDELVLELEEVGDKSTLPVTADRAWIDEFVLKAHFEIVLNAAR